MGAAAGNGAAHKERVDFLYEEPQTKKEEFLLGKPVEIKPEESEVKKVRRSKFTLFGCGPEASVAVLCICLG